VLDVSSRELDPEALFLTFFHDLQGRDLYAEESAIFNEITGRALLAEDRA